MCFDAPPLTPYQVERALRQREVKACSRCGDVKPYSEFSPRSDRGRRGGPALKSHCKACCVEWVVRYKREHPERVKRGDPQLAAERSKRWKKQNRQRANDYDKRRYHRLRASGGDMTEDEWSEIVKRYDHRCLCCGKQGEPLDLDHVIPVSLGGRHEAENVQPLCGRCNRIKGTKVIDYRPHFSGATPTGDNLEPSRFAPSPGIEIVPVEVFVRGSEPTARAAANGLG